MTISHNFSILHLKEGDFLGNSFSKYIVDERILFKHAKGTGAITGREFHEYNELVLFLDGELEFFSDEIRMTMEKRQLVIIPKQQYHQFVIKGNEDNYHRCVFDFYDLPELSSIIENCTSSLRIIDATDDIMFLFEKAIAISESDIDEKEQKALIGALLSLVINECAKNLHTEKKKIKKAEKTLSMKCIEYINAHLYESLSITDIAQKLLISESLLSHVFKKEMGISPYRYILKKRLVSAQERIANGESATTVAIECGFSDYSGFYKQYKKTFGSPPSKSSRYFSQSQNNNTED